MDLDAMLSDLVGKDNLDAITNKRARADRSVSPVRGKYYESNDGLLIRSAVLFLA